MALFFGKKNKLKRHSANNTNNLYENSYIQNKNLILVKTENEVYFGQIAHLGSKAKDNLQKTIQNADLNKLTKVAPLAEKLTVAQIEKMEPDKAQRIVGIINDIEYKNKDPKNQLTNLAKSEEGRKQIAGALKINSFAKDAYASYIDEHSVLIDEMLTAKFESNEFFTKQSSEILNLSRLEKKQILLDISFEGKTIDKACKNKLQTLPLRDVAPTYGHQVPSVNDHKIEPVYGHQVQYGYSATKGPEFGIQIQYQQLGTSALNSQYQKLGSEFQYQKLTTPFSTPDSLTKEKQPVYGGFTSEAGYKRMNIGTPPPTGVVEKPAIYETIQAATHRNI